MNRRSGLRSPSEWRHRVKSSESPSASSADLADARHDPHVQDHVAAVGDLDADFREPRSRRAHQKRHHEHRAALHRAVEQRRQLRARLVRRHPVVRRPRVVLVRRADEREVLGARDVVRRAAMQVAAWMGLLVQRDQLAGGEAVGDQPIAFAVRSIAVDDAIRLREGADLFDPARDRRGHRRWHRRELYPSASRARRLAACAQ